MIIVLSLLFLGAGIALIVNTVMSPHTPGMEFPRHGVTPVRNRRIVSVAVGAIIALGGVALLLLSRAGPP